MKNLVLIPAAAALAAMVQDSPVTLQHGQWTYTTRFDELDMPGQPPELVAATRTAIGAQQTTERCLSREEAANPTRSIVNNGDVQGCTFSRQVFERGRIDVAGSCPGPAGGLVRLTLVGSYTATAMDARIEAGIDGEIPMRMRGTMVARRIGKCRPVRR